jgi:uncharacterized membrane protein YbhN (UPF0104 family)
MSWSWAVYLAALALVGIDVLLRAVRLRLLLRTGPGARLTQAVAVNAVGDAASAVTPARLGGEAARFIGLRTIGIGGPHAVVTLGVERVVDLSLVALVTLGAALTLGGRGFRDVQALLERLVSPGALPWLVGVGFLVIGAAVAAYRYRARLPRAVQHSIGEAWRDARALSAWTLLATGALTLLSMLVRIAVLPLLLWARAPIPDPVPVFLGSFALLYSQLVLPTPAGAGGVELGFMVGVGTALPPGETAALLLVWRAYTLGVPAGLGGLVLLRRMLARRGAPTST